MKTYLKQEYQFKRSIMGLSSIILVKPDNLPNIIKEYMKVILDKLIEISKKCLDVKKTKKVESQNTKVLIVNIIDKI